ncbi:MAG: ABC transporter permease, partial [Christensenellales bacterium]
MTSTFRLTKAEFVKIFKRPSIFIMAIFIVVTILASITIFNPSTRVDNTIVYEDASTAQEYYEHFYDDKVINSKSSFDEKYTITDNTIKYYQAINTNANLLTDYYIDVIDKMNEIIQETNPSKRDSNRLELIEFLNKFRDAYKNLDTVKEFTDISGVTLTNVEYEGLTDNRNYYLSDACSSLDKFYNYVNNLTDYSSSDIVNIYLKNNYEASLNKVLNNGINFVYTTIKGLVIDFDKFYLDYATSIGGGAGNMYKIKATRANLLKSLKLFNDYYNSLISSEFPVILISNDNHLLIKEKVEEAIEFLSISVTDNENLDKHKDVKSNLDKTNIYNFLKNLTSNETSTYKTDIVQVFITNRLVDELIVIQNHVNENKTQILDSVYGKIKDESIKNISKEITNYSLLQTTYSSLVTQKILINITNNYDQSTYKSFYGYHLKDFNKYEANESITTNSYYIANNKYENSYLNNFSFSQNSGEKTNMYDFVYFSMELCTLIIIIFAMMLVCNLITGETESGTIKLLLVRPYKRSKIITAKLLATIFFVLSFMIFSSVITFVGGYFLYGSTNLSALAIFNGTTAFEIAPFWLMIINIITLTLDVIFFV